MNGLEETLRSLKDTLGKGGKMNRAIGEANLLVQQWTEQKVGGKLNKPLEELENLVQMREDLSEKTSSDGSEVKYDPFGFCLKEDQDRSGKEGLSSRTRTKPR